MLHKESRAAANIHIFRILRTVPYARGFSIFIVFPGIFMLSSCSTPRILRALAPKSVVSAARAHRNIIISTPLSVRMDVQNCRRCRMLQRTKARARTIPTRSKFHQEAQYVIRFLPPTYAFWSHLHTIFPCVPRRISCVSHIVLLQREICVEGYGEDANASRHVRKDA